MSDRLRDKAARLYAQGKTVSQVASEMGVTTKTAEKWERLARKRGTAYRAVGSRPQKTDTKPAFKAKAYGKKPKAGRVEAKKGSVSSRMKERRLAELAAGRKGLVKVHKAFKDHRSFSEALRKAHPEISRFDPSHYYDMQAWSLASIKQASHGFPAKLRKAATVLLKDISGGKVLGIEGGHAHRRVPPGRDPLWDWEKWSTYYALSDANKRERGVIAKRIEHGQYADPGTLPHAQWVALQEFESDLMDSES